MAAAPILAAASRICPEAALSHIATGAVRLFHVTLVGISAETGPKLLYTIGLVLLVLGVRALARCRFGSRRTPTSRPGSGSSAPRWRSRCNK